MNTHHLLMLVEEQWRHGFHRHGLHWRHWHTALRYIRRLAGPHMTRGYARQFLHEMVSRHIAPRRWARENQS